MKKLMAILAAGVLFQGCLGGGGNVYPDTDVIEPKDFGDPKIAQGIRSPAGSCTRARWNTREPASWSRSTGSTSRP